MFRLIPIMASVLATDMGAVLRRLRRNAFLYALVVLLLVSAYAALLVGCGLYLAALTDPLTAALLVAAGLVATAVLVLGVMAVANAIQRRRERDHGSGKALAAAAAVTILPTLARSKGILGIAVLGGLAVYAASRAARGTDQA